MNREAIPKAQSQARRMVLSGCFIRSLQPEFQERLFDFERFGCWDVRAPGGHRARFSWRSSEFTATR
jgi:hypothetical protein